MLDTPSSHSHLENLSFISCRSVRASISVRETANRRLDQLGPTQHILPERPARGYTEKVGSGASGKSDSSQDIQLGTMEEDRFRQMIDRARAGDEDAGDWLFVACYGPLRSIIAGMMDGILSKAKLEPEDIIQEVYAAAWPKIPEAEFDNSAAFVGWLKTIAKHKIIDLRRNLLADKNDVRCEFSDTGNEGSSYLGLVANLPSPQSAPSRGVARHEALAILTGRIWRLPEDHRRVIQWRYIQGLPVAEVAERLGRSESAVHMLCHRALKKLKELMGSPSQYLSGR